MPDLYEATCHWSKGSLLRRVITPKGHYSKGSLLQKEPAMTLQSNATFGAMTRRSNAPFGATDRNPITQVLWYHFVFFFLLQRWFASSYFSETYQVNLVGGKLYRKAVENLGVHMTYTAIQIDKTGSVNKVGRTNTILMRNGQMLKLLLKASWIQNCWSD